MGSLCQSALAAFLFSPAGLLALVAIMRQSKKVTAALITTMVVKSQLFMISAPCSRSPRVVALLAWPWLGGEAV